MAATNDAANPTVRVPVDIEVMAPITVRPQNLFFGFVDSGADQTGAVTLTASIPFEITGTAIDGPGAVTVEVAREGANSYMLQARVHAPEREGPVEGSIRLRTDLPTQPTVAVPYYACVSQ